MAGIVRIVTLCVGLTAGCGWIGGNAPSVPTPPGQAVGSTAEQVAILTAKRAIPRGHVLTPEDVNVGWVARAFYLQSLADASALPTGRAMIPILPGQVLRYEQFSQGHGPGVGVAIPPAPPVPSQPPSPLLMFAADLQPGVQVDKNSLFLVEVSPEMHVALGCPEPDSCFDDWDAVAGQFIASPVIANEVVRREHLSATAPPPRAKPKPLEGWSAMLAVTRTIGPNTELTVDDLSVVWLLDSMDLPQNPIARANSAQGALVSTTRLLEGELLRKGRYRLGSGVSVTLPIGDPPGFLLGQYQHVLVAARDIQPNRAITSADYDRAILAANLAAAIGCDPLHRCFTPDDPPEGQFASEIIFEGEPLRRQRVTQTRPVE